MPKPALKPTPILLAGMLLGWLSTNVSCLDSALAASVTDCTGWEYKFDTVQLEYGPYQSSWEPTSISQDGSTGEAIVLFRRCTD